MRAAVLLATLVSVPLALLLGWLLLGRPEPRPPITDHEFADQLRQLQQRLATLEAQVARLAETPLASSAPVTPRTPLAADVEARLSALERRTDESVSAAAARVTGAAARQRAAAERAATDRAAEEQRERDAIAEAKARIVDPRATVDEKIAAQERLRRVADAYTPAMVVELIRIATSDPDPQRRAKVWCLFDGTTRVPELVPHLLRALATEPAAVRSEAAETLGDYADDPQVLEALRRTAAHDPDEVVREKARRTVGPPERGR